MPPVETMPPRCKDLPCTLGRINDIRSSRNRIGKLDAPKHYTLIDWSEDFDSTEALGAARGDVASSLQRLAAAILAKAIEVVHSTPSARNQSG